VKHYAKFKLKTDSTYTRPSEGKSLLVDFNGVTVSDLRGGTVCPVKCGTEMGSA